MSKTPVTPLHRRHADDRRQQATDDSEPLQVPRLIRRVGILELGQRRVRAGRRRGVRGVKTLIRIQRERKRTRKCVQAASSKSVTRRPRGGGSRRPHVRHGHTAATDTRTHTSHTALTSLTPFAHKKSTRNTAGATTSDGERVEAQPPQLTRIGVDSPTVCSMWLHRVSGGVCGWKVCVIVCLSWSFCDFVCTFCLCRCLCRCLCECLYRCLSLSGVHRCLS